MTNTQKKIAIGIVLLSKQLMATEWRVETRVALGPAWHQFSSYEAYTPTPKGLSLDYPQSQVTTTAFDLIPWGEGAVRLYGDSFNVWCVASGGGIPKSIASLEDFSLVPGTQRQILIATRAAQTAVTLAVVDVGAGYEFCFGKVITLNPVVGYVFNQEALTLTIMGISDNFYRMRNIWKGPYIGCEAGAQLAECFGVTLRYAFVFGNFRSPLVVEQASFPPNPNGVRSFRKAAVWGDLVAFDATYQWAAQWTIGTGLRYFHYRNHGNSVVKLGEAVQEFVSEARLKQILWQQLMWTFFVEALY